MTKLSKSQEKLERARTNGDITGREYSELKKGITIPADFTELVEAETRIAEIKKNTLELREGVAELRQIGEDMFFLLDKLRYAKPEG